MTAIVLGLALLAVLALFAWREREHDRERTQMLDHITAPEAAQAAAFSRALGAEAIDTTDLDAEDDFTFGRDITDDLDPILAGGDT